MNILKTPVDETMIVDERRMNGFRIDNCPLGYSKTVRPLQGQTRGTVRVKQQEYIGII